MKAFLALIATSISLTIVSTNAHAAPDLLPGQTQKFGRHGSFYPETSNDQPSGFQRAICKTGGDYAEYVYCMARIRYLGSRPAVSVWRPPVRESGSIDTYVGDCLDTGCRFLGPDYGYPDDPVRYTLARPADPYGQVYVFRGGNNVSFRIYVPSNLPIK